MDIDDIVHGIMTDMINALEENGLSWSPVREFNFEMEVKELIRNTVLLIVAEGKKKHEQS